MKNEEILALERELYRRSQRPQPIKKRESTPSPVKTLDEKTQRLTEELEDLLVLLLAGSIEREIAEYIGRITLNEAKTTIISDYEAEHKPPPAFTPDSERIRALTVQTHRELGDIISNKPSPRPYWNTDEARKERLRMLAHTFNYRLNAELTIQHAKTINARHLIYHTMDDPQVCETCYQLEAGNPYSVNNPTLPIIPQHPRCRCWWTITT